MGCEMKFIPKPSYHWIIVFIMKILGCFVLFNLLVLPILWILKTLYLFALILTYEALFIIIVGVLQILGSYIYRKNSIHSRWAGLGSRTGWFNFEKFAKLKPEERMKYRQEGTIMIILGLTLLIVTTILHFSIT